jgi:hypothetical protein
MAHHAKANRIRERTKVKMGTYDTTHGGAISPQDHDAYDPAYDIQEERNAQIARWGNDFDDTHTQNDWVAFITSYAGKAMRKMPGEEGQQYPDPDGFCSAMVKVGALAFAALEAVQRHQAQKEAEQNAANGA